MTQVFDLQRRNMPSTVLQRWVQSRAGAPERMHAGHVSRVGIQAAGENSSTNGMSLDELVNVLGVGNATASGVAVNETTAMRVATAYACIGLVAGAIATLPVGIFERDGNTRRKADHEYWWLFNEQACEDFTSYAAWEYLLRSKLMDGDGFAQLLRPGYASARVIGFKPWHPRRVQPFTDIDGTLYYRMTPAQGAAFTLSADDVLHFPSLGFDGLCSPSPITHAARESIATALAAESYTGRFFKQGATFDYALKTAGTLKEDQLEMLKKSLIARVSGGANNRVPLILTGGLEPANLSVNSKDAEILATRIFNTEEICRVFGVPPHMVGHTDKSTSWGTGIEQQGIGFVRYTLQKHLTGMAQELNRKLWPTRSRYFVEHITAALERGDLKTRYEAYRIAIGRAGEQGWMDVDEIRRLENLPPNAQLNQPQGTSNASSPAAAAG